jgi:hypothetical protein
MNAVRIAILANAMAAVSFVFAPDASAQTGPGVNEQQGQRPGVMRGGQGTPLPPMGMMPGMPGGAGGNMGGRQDHRGRIPVEIERRWRGRIMALGHRQTLRRRVL